MTALQDVADCIKNLNVTGVVIYGYGEIPPEVGIRAPAIVPIPEYITDFSMVRDSFGGGSTAKITATYSLHYRLLYSQVGSGRANTFARFAGMVETAEAFLAAVMAIDNITSGGDTYAVDVVPGNVPVFGVVNDPSEKPFWGCDFTLVVTEFVN